MTWGSARLRIGFDGAGESGKEDTRRGRLTSPFQGPLPWLIRGWLLESVSVSGGVKLGSCGRWSVAGGVNPNPDNAESGISAQTSSYGETRCGGVGGGVTSGGGESGGGESGVSGGSGGTA